jgi:hypothetical protein
MMPYDRGLAYLKEKASQFGLSPNSSENCRARLDLIRPIHRAIISDYQRLSLRSPHPRQPFYTVNGARWPGSMFSRYIRQQIRLINNPVVDVGENHPLLKIGPHDHIIGNPQAPRKIFLYASIVRLVHTPLVAGGIREPLATLIQTGQLALVYRSFHFEDMKTRRPEMITACVPKKEFPAFLASLVTSTSAGIISVMADPSSFLADMAQAAGAKPRCFDDPATADAVSATIRSGIEQLSIVRVPAAVYRGAIYRNFMVTPAGVIDWMNRAPPADTRRPRCVLWFLRCVCLVGFRLWPRRWTTCPNSSKTANIPCFPPNACMVRGMPASWRFFISTWRAAANVGAAGSNSILP